MKIEGIVLHKTVFKERDLILNLLLRNGRRVSALFYGGRGGGSKKKSSILDLGHCLEITLTRIKNSDQTLFKASEWKLLWGHQRIRYRHQCFYLMTLFLEIIKKLSTEDGNLKEEYRSDTDVGLFKVLSNALFYLDQEENMAASFLSKHLSFFLSKLIFELGIAPDLKSCLSCNELFNGRDAVHFSLKEGGFFCFKCHFFNEGEASDQGLLSLLRSLWQTRYLEIGNFAMSTTYDYPKDLLRFLCFQYDLREDSFKSSKMLF